MEARLFAQRVARALVEAEVAEQMVEVEPLLPAWGHDVIIDELLRQVDECQTEISEEI